MRTLTAYNEDNFRQIEQYKGISVVRFSAPWCPPCQASEEMFSQFADRLDRDIQVGKVNVDQAPVLTTKYELQTTYVPEEYHGDQRYDKKSIEL